MGRTICLASWFYGFRLADSWKMGSQHAFMHSTIASLFGIALFIFMNSKFLRCWMLCPAVGAWSLTVFVSRCYLYSWEMVFVKGRLSLNCGLFDETLSVFLLYFFPTAFSQFWLGGMVDHFPYFYFGAIKGRMRLSDILRCKISLCLHWWHFSAPDFGLKSGGGLLNCLLLFTELFPGLVCSWFSFMDFVCLCNRLSYGIVRNNFSFGKRQFLIP